MHVCHYKLLKNSFIVFKHYKNSTFSTLQVNSLSFMPLAMCPSEDCRVNKAGGRLYLQTRGSKFIKFQELRIQEHVSYIMCTNLSNSVGTSSSLYLLISVNKTRLSKIIQILS